MGSRQVGVHHSCPILGRTLLNLELQRFPDFQFSFDRRGLDLPFKLAVVLKHALAIRIKQLRAFRTVVGDAHGGILLSYFVDREGPVEHATGACFQLSTAIIGLRIITVGTCQRDNLDG